ncbi:hypothetical protein, partial [Deinococcus sedimenti]|uniref:hypothetical protein n=1 Tax=Deinococcus sedimenti TaxID=1867090 RepID=UPI001E31FE3A
MQIDWNYTWDKVNTQDASYQLVISTTDFTVNYGEVCGRVIVLASKFGQFRVETRLSGRLHPQHLTLRETDVLAVENGIPRS